MRIVCPLIGRKCSILFIMLFVQIVHELCNWVLTICNRYRWCLSFRSIFIDDTECHIPTVGGTNIYIRIILAAQISSLFSDRWQSPNADCTTYRTFIFYYRTLSIVEQSVSCIHKNLREYDAFTSNSHAIFVYDDRLRIAFKDCTAYIVA